MSSGRSGGVSLWTVLRENGKLVVLYGLGAVVAGLLWWPLALIYLGYCLLSILLFIALICPYCGNYHSRSCPNAYHLLSIFRPRKGRKFADQFNRYVFVTFPAWAIPPIAGLYLLFTDFSWLLLALVAAFGLFGFVVFPYVSRDVCATCKNARNCPRHKGRFVTLGHEGSQDAMEKVSMKTRLGRLIAAPVFEGDEEKTRIARLLNAILFIVFGLVAIYTVITLITDLNLVGLAVEGSMILVSLGLLLFIRRGYVRLASWILSLLLWGIISVGTYYYGGLLGSGVASFFGIVLIAGLLLGASSALLFAGLSVLSTAVMLATEVMGVAPPPPEFITPAYRWAEFSTTVIGVASLFYLVIRSLEGALGRARRNEREAVEASNFKTHLIARISHELRTPLGAVLGLTEMLDCAVYGPLSGEQHQVAAKIVRNSQRLNRLVAQLLDQSHFEAGTFKLRAEEFSPRSMIESVVAVLRPAVEGKGLLLGTDIENALPDTVIGDPGRVEQILYHLLENAAKFTKVGSINVRAYRPNDGRWVMQVTDTGLGIPEDAREYIFDPFRQVDESVTREYGGFGLGLATVKQLVTLMGGEVVLESEVGRGSTFRVSLPLEPIEEGDNV
jgi:signal transduction histidine kinase